MSQLKSPLPAPPEVSDSALAERLREAREYIGFTQEEVAEALGLQRASVSAIETGRRKVGSQELLQLSRLYKRPVAALLGEEEEAPATDPTTAALFRAAKDLNARDREQVLRFAEFLKQAGGAPSAVRGDR